MRKFFILLLSVLLFSSMLQSYALAMEADNSFTEIMEMVQKNIGPGKAKGAVISVIKDGKIEICQGLGFADEENSIKADGYKTAFRIGSISKTFVAVAAQILVQDGRLDMNTDISKYLETDFPKLRWPVTMHQLLSNTAGFEDMVTGMAVFNVSDTEPLSTSVRRYMPEQVFTPGEITSYSNYGIALAAYVVQQVAGQDFSKFCSDNIFLPLHMSRTTFEFMHDIVYVSKPYRPDGNETLEPYMNLYPEGSAVSTAEDMAKYMQWLMDTDDSRVLSGPYKQELFKSQFSMDNDIPGVGYTWNIKSRNGHLYYDKKGETLHFYSRIALYPNAGTGIFLSFNTFLSEHEINAIMNRAADLLYGKAGIPYDSPASEPDISGSYVNNWSNFTTPEKILRYIVPGKIIHIKSTPEKGFTLNGKAITLLGENTYLSPMGILKFLKKGDDTIIATEAAITFTRLPFPQYSALVLAFPVLFVVSVLACFIEQLICLIRKKSRKNCGIIVLCSAAQLLAFISLCMLLYYGIVSFSLLNYTVPLKICGYIILGSTILGAAHVVSLKPVPVSWCMWGSSFCIWMLFMNIL